MWTKNLLKFAVISAFVSLMLIGTGCSDDTATASSCSSDATCALGQVCSFENLCISVACDTPCTAEQVCYVTAANPQGSCSAPECASDQDCTEGTCNLGLCGTGGCATNDDCGAGQVCNLAGQCQASDGTCANDGECPSGEICKDGNCSEGCSANDQCDAGQYCDATGTCQAGCADNTECGSNQICTDGKCACTPGTCGEGRFCDIDSGSCTDATMCSQISCVGGQVCNPVGLVCQDPCTAESCMANEVCSSNGICEVSNCPGEDPAQCDGNLQRPVWDPIKCFCAECLSDSECNVAAGEVCNVGGKCFACQTACDPSVSGTCGAGTPYCVDECCVGCIGAADCTGTQICLDGFCGEPPNCQVDPTVCPVGYTCDQTTGQCNGGQSGGSCDAQTACPDGQFCDPTTSTCSGDLGGGFGCGLCNADCTCDGGLSCDGLFCTGCDITGSGILGPPCPNSGLCIPNFFGGNLAEGICFGF